MTRKFTSWISAVSLGIFTISAPTQSQAVIGFLTNPTTDLAIVVSSCGTAPTSYVAGQSFPLTVDTTGVLCTSSSGGGGGNVVVTGPLGSSTIDTQAVATTFGGTSPTGFVLGTICPGAVGAKGEMDCLLTLANGPIPAQTAWSAGVASVNIGGVSGVGASGAAIAENPLLNGARAATTEPTVVTDGQKVNLMATKTGKMVNMPFAPAELWVHGTVSTNTNTAQTLANAPGAGVKLRGWVSCGRSDAGTTAITVQLNDSESIGSGHIIVLPNNGGGGGWAMSTPVPIEMAANTALTFTASSAITSTICNFDGYTGT